MLDYSEWELLSKTWKEVTAGQDIKADSEGVRRLISKEKDHYFLRKKYITKGDEIIDTYLFVQSIFDKSGEIQYFLATITPCEIVIDKDEKMCPVSNDTSAPNPYLYSLKQNWVQFLLIVGSLIGLIYQYGQNQQKIENRISTLEKDFKAIVQKNEDVLEEIKQSLKNIKK
jgi:RNA polymerase subunit RPABC4/transcription elongation factor Spt4